MRPIFQRAFQEPKRSAKVKVVEILGIFLSPIANQAIKPGTASLISPPPAEFGGPQQGGFSGESPTIGKLHPEEASLSCPFFNSFIALLFS
jgi:hypothetical protein